MYLLRKYLIRNGKVLHLPVQVMLVVFALLTVVSNFSILEKSPVEIEITESDDTNSEDAEAKLKNLDLWLENFRADLNKRKNLCEFRNTRHNLPSHFAANISTPPPEFC
ncbi:MAG: hypothetical protein ACPF9D_05315 [Owenweeksia sp.]